MKSIILSLMFISLVSNVKAQDLNGFCPIADHMKVGQKVDVRLNQYSENDLGIFPVRAKSNCTFLGIAGNMYIFQYDGEKIIVPSNSIKMIIVN